MLSKSYMASYCQNYNKCALRPWFKPLTSFRFNSLCYSINFGTVFFKHTLILYSKWEIQIWLFYTPSSKDLKFKSVTNQAIDAIKIDSKLSWLNVLGESIFKGQILIFHALVVIVFKVNKMREKAERKVLDYKESNATKDKYLWKTNGMCKVSSSLGMTHKEKRTSSCGTHLL